MQIRGRLRSWESLRAREVREMMGKPNGKGENFKSRFPGMTVGDGGYGRALFEGLEGWAVYSGQSGIVYYGMHEQSNPQFGRCEMAKGGRPKREARKSKKTTPSAVNFSPVMVPTPAVEVIKKKRKAKYDDF